MSSILEALRELDSQRPPAMPGVTVPAEPPTSGSRALETLGIVSIGLVIGALGFLLYIGVAGLLRSASRDRPAPKAAEERTVKQAAPEAPAVEERTPGPPTWLDRAAPPRASFAGQMAARSDTPAARERSAPESRIQDPSHVEIATIEYGPDVAHRSVTLRVDGATVRLRERESVHGLEVQSIQPNGVYVRRGGDVFMLAPAP